MSFRIVPTLTTPMRAVVADARPIITNIARRSRAGYARFSDMVFIAIARAGGEGFGHDERSETGEVASVMISSRAEVASEAPNNPLFALIARALAATPADPDGLQPTLVVSDLADTWVGLAGVAGVSLAGLLDETRRGSERLARVVSARQAEIRAALAAAGVHDPDLVVAFVQAGVAAPLDRVSVRIMRRADLREMVAAMEGGELLLPWLDKAPGDGKLSVLVVGYGAAHCASIQCGLLPSAEGLTRARCDDLELRTLAVSSARAVRALYARWSTSDMPSTLCLVVSANPVVSAWLEDLVKTVGAPADAVARFGGVTACVLWREGLAQLRVAHLADSAGLLAALVRVGGSAADPALLVCGPRSFAAGRCASDFGVAASEPDPQPDRSAEALGVLRRMGPSIARRANEVWLGGAGCMVHADGLAAVATVSAPGGSSDADLSAAHDESNWRVVWMTRQALLDTGIATLDGMARVAADLRAPFNGTVPVVLIVGSVVAYDAFPLCLGSA